MSQNTAIIFCIGRELLEGLVLDRNANFMAGKLSEAGVRVRTIQVLDDDREVMIAAFSRVLAKDPAFVFTTGGMGPGHDDITRECVAAAAELDLICDDGAVDMVAKSYRRLAAKGIVDNADLTDARRKMALVPAGSICFENPMGTAPAVQLRVEKTCFFLLPGQPQELQQMFDLYVLPAIAAVGPGAHRKARHIDFPGSDESALTRLLADASRRHSGVHTKATLQSTGRGGAGIRITIFGEHTDATELDSMLEEAEADIRARLGLEVPRQNRPRESAAD